MQRILFYTRGGEGFGMGHLYRTSWLIEALREPSAQNGLPEPGICVRSMDTAAARDFWAQRDAAVEFFEGGTQSALSLLPLPAAGDVIIMDWLESDPALLRELRAGGARLLLLDEYGPGQLEAELVINSLLAPLEQYAGILPRGRLLSGARYLALPPALGRLLDAARSAGRSMEGLLAQAAPAEPGPLRSVLLNFGGEPVPKAAALALNALAALGFDGRVIIMPGDSSTALPAGLDCEIRPAGEEFHDLLAACDLCICAGGLALYEAAALGVPAVAISLVEHQRETAMKLSLAGCCMYAGPLDSLEAGSLQFSLESLLRDPLLRSVMSARGQQLLDGLGSQRVALEILQLCAEQGG